MEITGTRVVRDGREYRKRMNGSTYPKQTALSVSQSVRRVCDLVVRREKLSNYDELLLNFVGTWFLSEKRTMDKCVSNVFEEALTKVKPDCRLREMARERADAKQRYRPRQKQ